jgi:hypothetical protein
MLSWQQETHYRNTVITPQFLDAVLSWLRQHMPEMILPHSTPSPVLQERFLHSAPINYLLLRTLVWLSDHTEPDDIFDPETLCHWASRNMHELQSLTPDPYDDD